MSSVVAPVKKINAAFPLEETMIWIAVTINHEMILDEIIALIFFLIEEYTVYFQMSTYLREQDKHMKWKKKSDKDHEARVDKIFANVDKDNDAIISHEEFNGPKHDHDELWF